MDFVHPRTFVEGEAPQSQLSFEVFAAIADERRSMFGSYTWPEDAAAAQHAAASSFATSSASTASGDSYLSDGSDGRALFPEDTAASANGEGLRSRIVSGIRA